MIAIILIILAVALPKLTNARRYAQEMAAAKAITTIHTAETQYYSQYGAIRDFADAARSARQRHARSRTARN